MPFFTAITKGKVPGDGIGSARRSAFNTEFPYFWGVLTPTDLHGSRPKSRRLSMRSDVVNLQEPGQDGAASVR